MTRLDDLRRGVTAAAFFLVRLAGTLFFVEGISVVLNHRVCRDGHGLNNPHT